MYLFLTVKELKKIRPQNHWILKFLGLSTFKKSKVGLCELFKRGLPTTSC